MVRNYGAAGPDRLAQCCRSGPTHFPSSQTNACRVDFSVSPSSSSSAGPNRPRLNSKISLNQPCALQRRIYGQPTPETGTSLRCCSVLYANDENSRWCLPDRRSPRTSDAGPAGITHRVILTFPILRFTVSGQNGGPRAIISGRWPSLAALRDSAHSARLQCNCVTA